MNLSTRIIHFAAVVFLLLQSHFLHSQYWAGVGYNASAAIGVKQLNTVIDQYNNNRTYLSHKMQHIGYMGGFALHVGYMKKTFFDLGYTYAAKTVYAKGTPTMPINSVENELQLRTSFNAINICYGKMLRYQEKNSFGVGVSLNYGTLRVKYRTEEPSAISHADYKDIVKKGMLTFGLLGRWLSSDPGIMVEPYINFSVFGLARGSATTVNNVINPATAAADPSNWKFTASSAGIKVMFAVTTN